MTRRNLSFVGQVCSLIALVAATGSANSWWRTYGGPTDDDAYTVRCLSDGGYIVSGGTDSYGPPGENFYLLRINALGDTLWTRVYGTDSSEYVTCLRPTADSGFILVGSTSSNTLPRTQAMLVKVNATGDTVWTRFYGGNYWDNGETVRQTADGGYIFGGSTWSWGAGRTDAWLVKTNATGDTLWTRVYGWDQYEGIWDIEQMPDSGYICVGFTNSNGAQDPNVWLLRTDAHGDTLWTRTFGGTNEDHGYSVRPTLDGGFIILGTTLSFGAGYDDFYLIKTNGSGDTLWTRTFGGDNNDDGVALETTPDSGFILTGSTHSFGAGKLDVWLIKTDATGDTLWTRTFGDTTNEIGHSVQPTPDGGYIIAGGNESVDPPFDQVYLIKTDSSGLIGIADNAGTKPARPAATALPNPFVAYTTLPGLTPERVSVLDASGRVVGEFAANRIGQGLPPGVYFLRLPSGSAPPVAVIKLR